MKDILKWTVEEARSADREAKANGMPNGPTRPLMQWAMAQRLEEIERLDVEKGMPQALLAAVRICAAHGLVMPDWLANAFIKKFDDVAGARSGSWDDAFGRPYKKGTHLAAIRRNRQLRTAVHIAVERILEQDASQQIDQGLFEKVAAELEIGTTLTKSLYYSLPWRQRRPRLIPRKR